MKRRYKWLFTLAALAIFLVMGGKLPAEPLSGRAMVVGFGIDLAEDGEYLISAQILSPDATSENSGVASRVVSAPDKTIAGAMNKISERAGLTVALTHCNAVLVGEAVAKSPDLYSVMNYLITNNYLSENAYLFVAENSAKDILNSKTGFGNNASLFVQQLVDKHGDYSDVVKKTLQDFTVDYHRLGSTNWLPVIKKINADPIISGSSGGSEKESTEYLFSLDCFYVFKRNVFIGEYGAADAAVLNYVKGKVEKGTLSGIGAHGENIVLYVLDKKCKTDFDLDAKRVKIDLSLDTLLKEIVDVTDEDKFVDRAELTEEEIKNLGDGIKSNIEGFYQRLRDEDADIFGFKEEFYSEFGKRAADLQLSEVEIEVKVEVKVLDV